MDDIEFQKKMVAGLAKTGDEIIKTMDGKQAALMHHTFGISGEVGELTDAIKKHIIYNKPLDMENIIEEFGDIEFYMEGLRQELGITREQTIKANIEKLGKRYPNFEYSNQRAWDRADKQ